MTARHTYTPEEFREFDRLTYNTGSRDQVTRITARMALSQFVKDHGKEKCDAMWAVIEARDAGRGK